MTDSTDFRNGTTDKVDGINSPEQTRTSDDDALTSNDNSPKITLYFLQGSRAIRIAWLLEALALPYTLNFYDRKADGSVPEAFINDVGAEFGMAKSPVLKDGNVVMEESGTIVEYLCATYDPLHQLLPAGVALRTKMMTYVHAAEGTFMLHGVVPFYAHRIDSGFATAHHTALTNNTAQDLDYLDKELKNSGTRYLVDDTVSAADIMMGFSIQFILAFGLVPEGRTWEHVNAWVGRIENNKVYKRAVAKTGYKLEL